MNYRKIPRNIVGKLSLNEVYMYFCLVMKSDYTTLVSHIKRESLAEMVGTKKLQTITDTLKKLEDEGFIKIDREKLNGEKGKFDRNTYYIKLNGSYDLITDGLLELPEKKQLVAFLILMKLVTMYNSNDILYNQVQLSQVLGLSRPTINKYLGEAMEKGYILPIENGYRLADHKIFIITTDKVEGFYEEDFRKFHHWATSNGMLPPKYKKEVLSQIKAHYPEAELAIKVLEDRIDEKPEALSLEYILKVLTNKKPIVKAKDEKQFIITL